MLIQTAPATSAKCPLCCAGAGVRGGEDPDADRGGAGEGSGCPAGEAAAGAEGQLAAAGGSAARVQQDLRLRAAPARLRRQLRARPHAQALPRGQGNPCALAGILPLWGVWRVVSGSFVSQDELSMCDEMLFLECGVQSARGNSRRVLNVVSTFL